MREKLRKERNVEYLYFYKNDRQVARFAGYAGYNVVKIPAEWLLRMKDATVYHNHLQSSSFSFEDIELIVAYNAKEFIVCSPEFDYIVRRPDKGWGFTLEVTEDEIILDPDSAAIFEECMTLADQQLNADVAQGELLHSEREDFRMHYIWATFFGFKNIHYKRTPNT